MANRGQQQVTLFYNSIAQLMINYSIKVSIDKGQKWGKYLYFRDLASRRLAPGRPPCWMFTVVARDGRVCAMRTLL